MFRIRIDGRSPALPSRQRGAIGIGMVLLLTLLAMCLAAALDTGRLYLERQQVQRIADLAALDAAAGSFWLLNGIKEPSDLSAQQTLQGLARESAARNGFAHPEDVFATQGFVSPNDANIRVFEACVNLPPDANTACDSVEIVVRRTAPTSIFAKLFPGITDPTLIHGQAVAQRPLYVALSAGTTLLSLNTDGSGSLLGPVLRGLLGSGVDLRLVGYRGLATANISLFELTEGLSAIGVPITVGSLDYLLRAEPHIGISTLDLARAAIWILDNRRIENLGLEIQALQNLIAEGSAKLSDPLNLADIILINPDAREEGSLLNTLVSLGDLLNAGIFLANAGPISASSFAGNTIRLEIVQAPQIAIGPVGCKSGNTPPCYMNWRTEAKTAQINLLIDLDINLSLLRVTLNLNISGVKGYAGVTFVTPSKNEAGYEVSISGSTDLLTAQISNIGISIPALQQSLGFLGNLLNGLGLGSLLSTLGLNDLLGLGVVGIGERLQQIGQPNLLSAGPIGLGDIYRGQGINNVFWPPPPRAIASIGSGHAGSETIFSIRDALGGLTASLPIQTENCIIVIVPICTPTARPPIPLNLQPLLNQATLVDGILNNLLTPLLDALGIGINEMDVEILDVYAGSVDLVI